MRERRWHNTGVSVIGQRTTHLTRYRRVAGNALHRDDRRCLTERDERRGVRTDCCVHERVDVDAVVPRHLALLNREDRAALGVIWQSDVHDVLKAT